MNPYVLLVVGALWVVSLVGVGKWQRADGRAAERVEWQTKEAEALRTHKATVERLQHEARTKEKDHVDAITIIATNYATGYETLEKRRRADAAAAHSGALRLRVPATICPSFGSPPATSVASASGGDGAATVELPPKITADLFDLANDADQVADQLRACQTVLVENLK